jgi:hypothetical protein
VAITCSFFESKITVYRIFLINLLFQLFEAFNLNGHADTFAFKRAQLHVYFGPQHLGLVIRGQAKVDHPLARGVRQNLALQLPLLFRLHDLVLEALQEAD